MALPGYAAEASLYRTSRSYRGAVILTNAEPNDPVAKVLLSLLTRQTSDLRPSQASVGMQRPSIRLKRPPFGRPTHIGGGVFLDESNPCCCPEPAVVCDPSGDVCWPATRNVCIDCGIRGSCRCDPNGPYCEEVII
jgi:hypothetical protein